MSASRPIFLVGFMGCGKSAVGRILAADAGWDFFDTDALVEAREGQSIQQIFEERGEKQFRLIEWEVLRATAGSRRIVATGGGSFAAEAPRRFMLDEGATIWLDAPLAVIRERLRDGSGRPLWVEDDDDALRALFENRQIGYAQAPYRVDASGTADEVAQAVRTLFPSVFR